MTSKAEAIEVLADIEHERWGDWQTHLHSLGKRVSVLNARPLEDEAVLTLPVERVEHWETLIATPYAELPEHSKQADRDQVGRYWPYLVNFVGEWISREGGRFGLSEEDTEVMVNEWLAEMG